jgi:hypothetical protein
MIRCCEFTVCTSIFFILSFLTSYSMFLKFIVIALYKFEVTLGTCTNKIFKSRIRFNARLAEIYQLEFSKSIGDSYIKRP